MYTKSFLPLFLMLCLLYYKAQAQNGDNRLPVKLGFEVGGGLATQRYEATEQLSSQNVTTFRAGLSAILPLNRQYAVVTGAGILTKGGVLFEDALTTTTTIRYLELPVSLTRRMVIPLLGNLYLGAGGYIARGLQGRLKYETPDSEASDKLAFGRTNDIQRLDAGLQAIGKLELNNHLTFGAGYSFGLKNIVSQTRQETGTSSIRNRYVSVTLGYLFDL